MHNLGIKQPISRIVDTWRETGADAIGLSGLLVKSVNVMEENLRELNAQSITVPMLLGGAALSRQYAEEHLRDVYNGDLFYGKDAFEGLRVMKMITSQSTEQLNSDISERVNRRAYIQQSGTSDKSRRNAKPDFAGNIDIAVQTRSDVAIDVPVPTPPFWGTRVVEHVPLEQVYPYINTTALFRGQWHFRKGSMTDDDYAATIRERALPMFEQLKNQCADERILHPAVVYGYFPCRSDGDDMIIFDPDDHACPVQRFTFPRQELKRRLCISDFLRARDTGEVDVIGMHCVTVGHDVSQRARDLFESDAYQEYFFLHGLGVECAEALAELWHQRMRQELGIAGDDAPNTHGLFKQQYQGSRYSFGYPACPNMADQQQLFALLKPGRIGCTLTENWQIEPEQSTSAIIVHHPQAKYFTV